jgi:hypothetical protein
MEIALLVEKYVYCYAILSFYALVFDEECKDAFLRVIDSLGSPLRFRKGGARLPPDHKVLSESLR